MEQSLRDSLLKTFPVGVVDAAQLYGPAIGRMALAELVALAQMIADRLTEEAQAAVREKMSMDELAAEREKLADLAVLMANKRAESIAMGRDILLAILKVAFTMALGVVCL